MFKKTLTVAVAALTLTGATFTTTQAAQAGGLGKFIAAAVVGTVVGAVAAGSARSQEPGYRSDYRPARGGRGGGYGGCGTRPSPIFDENGNRIGFQRVPAC